MSKLETLIDSWRFGDQRAAEAIYQLHRDRTFRLAYALVGNAEDAEEAAQDALAYALQNIAHYDENRSKFSTWLHMITVSRCRDILRKRRVPTFSLADWRFHGISSLKQNSLPEQKAEINEMRNILWDAVQELNPMLREVIVLRHWGGHTYQEISEITGCLMKTAQSRVRLAHQKLAKSLAETDLPELLEDWT